jgi:hypothetical protein
MTDRISIHNLAVLRAAVEGAHMGAYFGSWAGLQYWISSTEALGLVDGSGKPTLAGRALAEKLDLSTKGAGRAYMWREAAEREKSAAAAIGEQP